MSSPPLGCFAVAPSVSWRDVPGELVLFDARDETYHTLNPSASQIWRLLARGADLEAATAALGEQFSAPREAIAADVAEFAAFALDRGLLVAA